MPRTRIAHTIGDWEKLAHVVTPETTAGSPYLEQAHAKLQSFLEEVTRLHAERAEHQARKQAATRRINEVVDEGRRLQHPPRAQGGDGHRQRGAGSLRHPTVP